MKEGLCVHSAGKHKCTRTSHEQGNHCQKEEMTMPSECMIGRVLQLHYFLLSDDVKERKRGLRALFMGRGREALFLQALVQTGVWLVRRVQCTLDGGVCVRLACQRARRDGFSSLRLAFLAVSYVISMAPEAHCWLPCIVPVNW